MKLFLTTLSLLPHLSEAWNIGPRFYDLDVWNPHLLQKQRALMEKQQDLLQKVFSYTSPRYKVTDTDDKFEVTVDVPGVKPEDIHVTFDESNGSVLSIWGSRASTDEDEREAFACQFAQSFSMDPSVDVKKLTANLKNGVLVVTAPKDLKQIEENVRKIPVMVASEEDASMDTPTPDTQEEQTTRTTVEEDVEVKVE